MLKKQLRGISSLLSSISLIGVCVGMTSTLLSLRATIEGFGTLVTGFIMSAYFIGYLFGSTRAPKDIRRVGYIRSFGGLAALAAASVLVQAIWIDPVVWFVMRFVTGFAISGIFVIVESWLNTMADNKSRGTLLSIYLVIIYSGLIAGQLILGVADPGGFIAFAIVVLLINLALIPILVSVTVEPTTHENRKVPVKMLLNTVPLGVINAFVMQACYAMFYGIGPMYASYIGLSVLQITFFMSAFIVGGLLSQTPFGLLSDRIDRRIVIAICAAGGTAAAILLAQLGAGNALLIYLVVAVLGAFILPLYSLGMAHTNDYLEKDQMVGATGAIIKIGGAGSIIGAPAVAALMQFGAINYFFLLLGGLTAFVGCYALYRITRRAKAEEQLHSNFAILAPSQTSDELLTSMAEEAPDEEDDTEEEVDGTAVLKR
ncbi:MULTISPECIES: MFS transporter [Idiomarina]|jgi:MFS family permease|uniref:Permease of the major facilitator superfamily protein n=2 Tax=Idiomarina baltica TaxID=190892 RepID=A0ABP2CRM9_9GAMM|nr:MULTISPECIES: MFS transporter [Idiomarina]MBL73366.1 MFS transporter [Idiomarinaceae bacterium]MEC8925134.1 MFS transporter [Pseudomonadota bacterium]EAQ32522.1 Permease of the major facilitator superfamily protein [Idiomarina baltica OS145]KXS35590.1 MAG: major facilitator superfamily permease [Idiomarina sp. T82-3]MBR37643.1 MFS transporter [Idiomarina sp.]|tara:strand:+ start:769 stop:2058 length:1290 start_codon:yes stop_codon:yes gene_type:complete